MLDFVQTFSKLKGAAIDKKDQTVLNKVSMPPKNFSQL